MDSRFSHLAGGAWASGSPLGQLGFSQLQAAGTAVKIQAMRIGLPTTHQPPSPQRGEVYFLGSPSLGQVRSLVDYSLQIAPPRGKGRRGKSPSICKEHLKTENLNDVPNFLRCSPNTATGGPAYGLNRRTCSTNPLTCLQVKPTRWPARRPSVGQEIGHGCCAYSTLCS